MRESTTVSEAGEPDRDGYTILVAVGRRPGRLAHRLATRETDRLA
jgi:hypothetical protein